MNEPFLNPHGKRLKMKHIKRIKIRKNPLMVINPKGKKSRIKKHKIIPHKLKTVLPEIMFHHNKNVKTKKRSIMSKHKRSHKVRKNSVVKVHRRKHSRGVSQIYSNPLGFLKGSKIADGFSVIDIAALAGGAIAVRYLPTILPIPASYKTGAYRLIVQAGIAVGSGMIISKILKQKKIGNMIMIGGLVATAVNAIDTYVLQGKLASGDLHAFLTPYRPGTAGLSKFSADKSVNLSGVDLDDDTADAEMV